MCKKKSANDVAKRLLFMLPTKGYSQLSIDHASLKKWACRECGPTFMAAVASKMQSLSKNELFYKFYKSDETSQVSVSFNYANADQPGNVLITSPFNRLLSRILSENRNESTLLPTHSGGTTDDGIDFKSFSVFSEAIDEEDAHDESEYDEADEEENDEDCVLIEPPTFALVVKNSENADDEELETLAAKWKLEIELCDDDTDEFELVGGAGRIVDFLQDYHKGKYGQYDEKPTDDFYEVYTELQRFREVYVDVTDNQQTTLARDKQVEALLEEHPEVDLIIKPKNVYCFHGNPEAVLNCLLAYYDQRGDLIYFAWIKEQHPELACVLA